MATRKFLPFILAFLSWCNQYKCDIPYLIEEELPRDTLIGYISQDSGLAERYGPEHMDNIRYSFLSGATRYFKIDAISGIFKTASKLDRDTICKDSDTCILTVTIATVANIESDIFFEQFTVHVELQDLNDNAPTFDVPFVTLPLSESSLPGKVLILPQARDPDTSGFTIESYRIKDLPDIPFSLVKSVALDGSTELKLILQSHIDREVTPNYHFTVVAEDGGNPPRSGTLNVNITVQDTNDHAPVFERQSYESEVAENTPIGTTFLTVTAYDVDIGPNGDIVYGLASRTQERYGHMFGVEEDTGELFVNGELDYETDSTYQLVLTATDRGPDAQIAQCYVTVHLTDINDCIPSITVSTLRSGINAKVLELAAIDTFVAHVRVVDEDVGASGDVTCGLNSDFFRLNPINDPSQYTIVTNRIFDREAQDLYTIYLRCEDRGEPPLSSGYNLSVEIEDANDHAPRFTKSLYSANIEENSQGGEYVLQVKAKDGDIGENAQIEYMLSLRNSKEVLDTVSLEPKTGVLRTKLSLDHERNSSVDIEIVAHDKGEPMQSTTAHISLAVLDLNDNPPVFGQRGYSFGTYENRHDGEDAGNVVATDVDSQPYDKVFYSIETSIPQYYDVHSKFRIDSENGYMYTRVSLDREEQDKYYFSVVAENLGYPGMSSSASVTIYIADENDNSPVFDFPSNLNNTVYVSNLAQMGHVVTRVRGQDRDFGDNAKLSFHLKDFNWDNFELDSNNGAVTVNADLSDLIDMEFNLTIEAEDNGSPKRSQSTVLIIVVTDGTAPWQPHTKSKNEDESSSAIPNFGIVIGVACGSTIVIALLAMAIIIIACKGRGHTRGKPVAVPEYEGQYNCRTTEAQLMLDGNPDTKLGTEGSQTNSPCKTNHYNSPVIEANDVSMHIANNLRNRNDVMTGSTPAIYMKTDSPYTNQPHKITDGTASLSRLHSPAVSKVPLSVCDGCVQSSPATVNHNSKINTTLVPLTDKEIEIHKVLRYLHSQQDDAESGCSETMSTSDSGRGNSVSEDNLDTHPRIISSAGHLKQVQFMPAPHRTSSPYQSEHNRDMERRDTSSPAQRHIINSSQHQRHNNHFSTFSGVNSTKTGAMKQPYSNGTIPKRQPARVSFQCPPYETQYYSSHNPTELTDTTKTIPEHTMMPMHKIEEYVSSADNLSDDSASTMSGSYVLQPDDRPRKTSSPVMLSPAVCRVLPTIQDSVV